MQKIELLTDLRKFSSPSLSTLEESTSETNQATDPRLVAFKRIKLKATFQYETNLVLVALFVYEQDYSKVDTCFQV